MEETLCRLRSLALQEFRVDRARAHGGRITWNLSSPQENVGNYRARRASAMFCIIIALAHDFSIFSHKNEIGK